MRTPERTVLRQAIKVALDDPSAHPGLTVAVSAYLSDEARKDRPVTEACGQYSLGWSMRCLRPSGHPLDADKPHEGFDTRGYRRHWKDW